MSKFGRFRTVGGSTVWVNIENVTYILEADNAANSTAIYFGNGTGLNVEGRVTETIKILAAPPQYHELRGL